MKNLWRLALATLISVALVIGFTGATATAAPARAAAQQTAQQTAERANECGQQQARVAQTKRNAKTKKAQLVKAGKVLKQANKRLQKAKKSGQKALVKSAKKNVKRAKANRAAKATKLRKARNMVAVAAKQLRACQQANNGGSTGGPLQPLCDAGLPQPICDALDALPLPGGVSTSASPIQALCDAGLPQAICDAATNVPSVPGGDNPLQALCDAGLPQGICDLASGQVGVDTLPIPGGLPGLPELPFTGLPDVAGLDALLALLAPLTSQLPLSTVCSTLDIPVVCDLVG